MVIRRVHLSRRAMLRGIGTAIALPALDSMVPACAAPQAYRSPVRLAFTYVPNGIFMKHWTPAQSGENFELPQTIAPLASFRRDILILTGLDSSQANDMGDGGGDHARASSTFLSGVHPKKTEGADFRAAITADQIAAREVGSATRFPSLQLGLDNSRLVGECDVGYSCAYMNISWRGPQSPLPAESNPRLVFERLFGADDPNMDIAARARLQHSRISILDLVRGDAERLNRTLGPGDRRKVDEYLDSIREVEKRIEHAGKDQVPTDPGMEKPAGVPASFADYTRLMFDLEFIALKADLTRVVTFMMGRETSTRTYNEIGVPDPHHQLSHHRNNPEWIDKLAKIDRYHVELFVHFLERLRSTPDGDGTLLDHSMILYGSGISDGNRHSHENLPVLVAGHGGGSLKTGRHLAYPSGTPVTNLYLTLLDRMGVRPEKIGDSTGRLENIAGV
jgi:hypothetical protein